MNKTEWFVLQWRPIKSPLLLFAAGDSHPPVRGTISGKLRCLGDHCRFMDVVFI